MFDIFSDYVDSLFIPDLPASRQTVARNRPRLRTISTERGHDRAEERLAGQASIYTRSAARLTTPHDVHKRRYSVTDFVHFSNIFIPAL